MEDLGKGSWRMGGGVMEDVGRGHGGCGKGVTEDGGRGHGGWGEGSWRGWCRVACMQSCCERLPLRDAGCLVLYQGLISMPCWCAHATLSEKISLTRLARFWEPDQK